MADFPLQGDGQRFLSPTTLAASRGTAVTPNASANTKGSYAALAAVGGNTQESAGIMVWAAINTGVETDYLMDLAVGTAGNEVVFVPDLLVSGAGASATGFIGVLPFYIPVGIPASSRVAARCQALAASSSALHVHCMLVAQGNVASSPLSRVTAYGPVSSSDTGAVSVDPGGSANTKGAWSELTASSTNPASMLLVAFGNQANTARGATGHWMVDIGIGAAGSEVVLLPNLGLKCSAGGSGATVALVPLTLPPVPVSIPAGTRIAARAQCNLTDATDRLLDVAVYGID